MGDDYGDVEVLQGMLHTLEENESRQLVVRDVPSVGWSFGHSTSESVANPGSNAWPYISGVQYDEFLEHYEDLFLDIARGKHTRVNELSEEEWPLFVQVCGHVEGLNFSEDELQEARHR